MIQLLGLDTFFFVSALNELIYLKYELILVDVNGKRIRKQDYTFAIENDELIVTDSENNLFTYNPCNEESRRMQETLFREKKVDYRKLFVWSGYKP